jgi:tetratricopeptide (TPR) repeat protein
MLLSGCATAYTEGVSAYQQGRYGEAADRFEDTLAEDPDRVEALVGLGLSRYRLGDWDAAVSALDEALARAPRDLTARLYLGLAYLQRAEDAASQQELAAFRDLQPGTALAAQVDRALQLMRAGTLAPAVRAYVAASLENAAEWQRRLIATEQALRLEELRRLSDERFIDVAPRRCRC